MPKLWKKKNDTAEKSESKTDNVLRLLLLIALTVTVLAVYRFFLNHPYFFVVMIAYMVIFTALILTYVLYNRGFFHRNVTRDMLPDSWSEAQKDAFLEGGKRRMERSRWMLIPIFAFGLTFAIDVMELFVLPFFKNLF